MSDFQHMFLAVDNGGGYLLVKKD